MGVWIIMIITMLRKHFRRQYRAVVIKLIAIERYLYKASYVYIRVMVIGNVYNTPYGYQTMQLVQ